MSKSSNVDVVPFEMLPHGNADALSIVNVFGGYTCCVRTADWQGVTKAAYIPPDSMVDTRRPEFSYLATEAKADGWYRVKARKLRGVVSFGILVPVPENFNIGDDVTEYFNVKHYEPEIHDGGSKNQFIGDTETSPLLNIPHYDLENLRKYRNTFSSIDIVAVHEKLDGTNCAVTWHNNRLWVKSRNNWKRRTPDTSRLTVENLVLAGKGHDEAQQIIDAFLAKSANKVSMYWEHTECIPGLIEYVKNNPGKVVFGEIYGTTNCIKYGPNKFAAFDIFDIESQKFLSFDNFESVIDKYNIPAAPLLYIGYYDFQHCCELAEGQSVMNEKVIREGAVVRSVDGRPALKLVSGAYLEKHR